MIEPGTLPLAGNRWTPFIYEIEFQDRDFTGAMLDMHVRLTFDTPGAPLIDLSPAAAGSEGLSLAVADGDTTITIQIDEATMEGLPDATEVGDDLVLHYDLHITPSGGTKEVYLRGPFTVRAGATQ